MSVQLLSDALGAINAKYIDEVLTYEPPAKRRPTHIWLKRCVAACLAVVLCFGTFIAVNAEARAAFVSWIRNVFEDAIVFFFQREPTDATIPDFHCAWLPESMEAEELLNSNNQGYVIYSDENGRSCTLFYTYMSEGTSGIVFDLSGTGLPYETVSINGSYGELYSDIEDGAYNLIWFDETSGIAFDFNSIFMTREEVIKMAESVKEGAVLDFMPEYKFTWLPDGYYIDAELTRGSHECHLASSSPAGKNLRLKYDIFEAASLEEQFRIKSETPGVDLAVGEQDAVLYLNIPNGKNSLLWLDKDTGIAFRLEAEENVGTMIAIAEAIQRK